MRSTIRVAAIVVVGLLALTSLVLLVVQWNSEKTGAIAFGSAAVVAGLVFKLVLVDRA